MAPALSNLPDKQLTVELIHKKVAKEVDLRKRKERKRKEEIDELRPETDLHHGDDDDELHKENWHSYET